MKKTLTLLLASTLVLGACSNDNQENKKEAKEKTKTTQQKTQTHANQTQGHTATPNNATNQNAVSKVSKTAIDVTNVTNRDILVAIIYGSYSEYEKIQAYNSAVANGVIPQGNVLEGPAWAAYESSLSIERGEEKSIFEYPPEDAEYIDEDYASYMDDATYSDWENEQDTYYEEETVDSGYDEFADYESN
ncbi:hypothetical protein [Staphylococcus rostri]|uniref:Lipoprotein n=1 Tax=Staphylococcus rostri TaxID=522262 RepID=A0A2K3YIQ0_9STAP|nr:hypothetical protein [Staphylococcus rostri]PNZ25459.1 hypothetical protein CD122_09865 [Staphylococcus rostri]